MSIPIFSKTLFFSLLVGIFVVGTSDLVAEAKFKVDKPSFDTLQSPEVGGNTNRKNFKPKDWLEVEVKFKIDAVRPESKDGFVDQAEVRWYVAVENPGKKGQYWKLEKSVTYVNIPIGEDVYVSVYISPNSVKRLSGSDRANKGLIWGVAGEITIAGTTQTFNSKSGSKKWWESGSLSSTDKVPLLHKGETPFKGLWWDRYAEIKERR